MKAALRGRYVEVVFFMGTEERYPDWFMEEIYDATYTDESRYTFWVDRFQRRPDYHEKQLVEDYSVFIRKGNGEVFVTDYDAYQQVYHTFMYDGFNNWALAGFNEDVIDYVECHGGIGTSGYPDWFYEYFTESLNNPQDNESIYISDICGELVVVEHCAVLRNMHGEIKVLPWNKFLLFYDPNPEF